MNKTTKTHSMDTGEQIFTITVFDDDEMILEIDNQDEGELPKRLVLSKDNIIFLRDVILYV